MLLVCLMKEMASISTKKKSFKDHPRSFFHSQHWHLQAFGYVHFHLRLGEKLDSRELIFWEDFDHLESKFGRKILFLN